MPAFVPPPIPVGKFIPSAIPRREAIFGGEPIRLIPIRAGEDLVGSLSRQELVVPSVLNRRPRIYYGRYEEFYDEEMYKQIDRRIREMAKAKIAYEEKERARADRAANEERQAKAEREAAEEERQSRAKRVAEEERQARLEREAGKEEERRARIEGKAAREEERRAKARGEAQEEKERQVRAEGEEAGEKERRDMSGGEEEEKERRDEDGGDEEDEEEERRAKGEREEEKERWRTRVERLIEEITQSLAKLAVEVERHAREKREAEEERRVREEREVEEQQRVIVEIESEKEKQARAERTEEIEKGEALYKAICDNNWTKVKEFLGENPSDVLATKVTSSGKTPLHVAALFGHVSIVEEILRLVTPQFLENTDDFGNTPILIATITGSTKVAQCLVNRRIEILGIPNSTSELPVTLAFLNGHQEMGRYLYSKTPLEYIDPEKAPPLHGALLLHCCLQTQCYDIALDLLKKCPELLFVSDKEGWRPIYGIATMNSAIPNRNELGFWKRYIIQCIDSNPSLDHDRLPIQHQDTSERTPENVTWLAVSSLVAIGHRSLQWVISSTYNLTGMKKIQELKLLHAQLDEIVNLVCKNASRSDQVSALADALFLAAEEGNVEFVLKISKANPDLLLIGDSLYQNIFCYAVRNRQDRVFNLIHGLRFKDVVLASKDMNGDTLLHVAATQAPPTVLHRIYGPALQVQRELQWFKEVESLMPPTIRGVRNNDGKTAEEIFKEKHQDLMKQGEKWVKATASSCSVVGTLIVTIMFTVAFTVPGGNDQTFGLPLLIKKPFFKVFIFSTIISLVSSSTSVLTFLAILTSHFSKEIFLKAVPSKLILGLSTLFISIVSMMVAFLSTVNLMLIHSNYSWGLLPIIMLASVPICLFVLSQLSLLRHSCFATYGSIFNKKVEKWP